ncbi:hypothetical protein LRS11_00275 [Pseudomonas sp. J452]|uniref:hypothetical protein n=1 Tax=Pseudomonas sp. J452 TaxID=2898441 RepID=UPI0021ADE5C8|nr:hypothetical protein [Pseudomonas sp. J452]UUY08520.1 hypothetical protein LRS11_00275 [Pseudomonas sp. J452]
MKKLSIFAACMLLAGAAQATVTYDVSGKLAVSDCPDGLLSEDVSINLSSNVMAGVECNASQVSIGTCSVSGRTTSRTVEDLNCTSAAGPDDRFGNPTTVETCVPFVPAQYTETTGAVIYTGSSGQGTIVPQYEGTACSASNAEAAAASRLQ